MHVNRLRTEMIWTMCCVYFAAVSWRRRGLVESCIVAELRSAASSRSRSWMALQFDQHRHLSMHRQRVSFITFCAAVS